MTEEEIEDLRIIGPKSMLVLAIGTPIFIIVLLGTGLNLLHAPRFYGWNYAWFGLIGFYLIEAKWYYSAWKRARE